MDPADSAWLMPHSRASIGVSIVAGGRVKGPREPVSTHIRGRGALTRIASRRSSRAHCRI